MTGWHEPAAARLVAASEDADRGEYKDWVFYVPAGRIADVTRTLPRKDGVDMTGSDSLVQVVDGQLKHRATLPTDRAYASGQWTAPSGGVAEADLLEGPNDLVILVRWLRGN